MVMILRIFVKLLIREEFFQGTIALFKLVLVMICVENYFGHRGDEFMSNKQHIV